MDAADPDQETVRSETERLIPPKQPTYLNFRLGREQPGSSRWTQFLQTVFTITFCSLGLWGQQKWNFIPRLLIGVICVYQAVYDLTVVVGCPGFDCGSVLQNSTETKKHKHKVDRNTQALYTVSSLAAVVSYFVLVLYFVLAKRMDSALVHPSQTTKEAVSRAGIMWLFLCFVLILLPFSGSVAVFYGINWCPTRNSFFNIMATGVGAQFLAQWVAITSCHVFAVSSCALGTLTDDTIRLIRDVQTGNLDDVIKIHEDLCTVVFNTVWAYSFWFIAHWFSYGVGVVLGVIYICEKFHYKDETPSINLGLLLVCNLYVFLLPCWCAAKITSSCTGIYEKINCTTSDDWPAQNHPFKDRRNLAMFVSYAKDRHCGFQIGRITFNSSLAWLSFFLGLTGLLFHFF